MGDAGVGANIIPGWDYMTGGVNEWIIQMVGGAGVGKCIQMKAHA